MVQSHISVESPFIIQNAPVYRWCDADIEDPSSEELGAPGLLLRLLDEDLEEANDETIQAFRDNLGSAFIDDSLPMEILDAMCGQASDWKIIRCVPQEDKIFFIMVNPAIYKDPDADDEFMSGVAAQLACGCVWVYLYAEEEEFRFAVEVSVSRDDKVCERYVIRRWRSNTYFEFLEYDADKLFRHSEVKPNNDGSTMITVVEYQ